MENLSEFEVHTVGDILKLLTRVFFDFDFYFIFIPFQVI